MTIPVPIIPQSRIETTNTPFTLVCVVGRADDVFVANSESTVDTHDVARFIEVTTVLRHSERRRLATQSTGTLDALSFRDECVFVLDAAEYIEDAFKVEAEQLIQTTDQVKDGYSLCFRLSFVGQTIRCARMYVNWGLLLFGNMWRDSNCAA